MASRLSSLLVRDGLVGVKRMEKAFQRQVIYGGSLDTILLEMNLVPEDRLSQYLALASGLPPATRAETNVFDAEAVRRCGEDLALRFRVVPLALADGALRLLVYDPVDLGMLEDLADALDLPVQPLIVPEYRWHMVYARAYGGTAPARYATLAKQADAAPITAPVGRARTVIVDAGEAGAGADHEVVDVAPERPGERVPERVGERGSGRVPRITDRPGRLDERRGLGGELLKPVGPEARTMRMDAVRSPDSTPEIRVPSDEITPPQVPLPRQRTRELAAQALAAQREAAERRDEPGSPSTPGAASTAAADPARGGGEAVPAPVEDTAWRTAAITARTRRTLTGVPAVPASRQSGPIAVQASGPSSPLSAEPSGRVPVVSETAATERASVAGEPTEAAAAISGRFPVVSETAPTARAPLTGDVSTGGRVPLADLARDSGPVPVVSQSAPTVRASDPTGPVTISTVAPLMRGGDSGSRIAPGTGKVRRASTEPFGSARGRRAASVSDIPDGDGPITAVAAREALAEANERDQIFTLLLRAIRSRARWAGLLTVQGGAAIGRLALAEPGLDTSDIASVLLPLDARSAFRTAIIERRHVVGPVATDDPDIDSMIARMGGSVPPAALLLPIVLRDRVVALAIGHRVDRPLGLGDVAELLPLAQVAADAVGRLIVRHKSLGYRAPTANPVPEITDDELPSKRSERTAGGWSVPRASTVPELDAATEVEINAEPPRPIAEVLDDIERGEGDLATDAMAEALPRAAEVLPLLSARFPGRLRIDRFGATGPDMRATQFGGLLDLIVRIGPPAADVLVEKMGDAHRDLRFYATVCAAEMRPRNAMYALVERLFDNDYGVRAVATTALAGYPSRDLDLAMVRARHALHSEDPERVQAAAAAVAALADILALPDLLDTVGRDDKRAEYARRALMAMTKQDFGISERKWRRWWEDNRQRHRIEWLIDGLAHKEAPLRQSAIDDLRHLSGEDFGYQTDLPRRDRDQVITRWRNWWTETGRRRFATRDDERQRPTAVLPQQRRP